MDRGPLERNTSQHRPSPSAGRPGPIDEWLSDNHPGLLDGVSTQCIEGFWSWHASSQGIVTIACDQISYWLEMKGVGFSNNPPIFDLLDPTRSPMVSVQQFLSSLFAGELVLTSTVFRLFACACWSDFCVACPTLASEFRQLCVSMSSWIYIRGWRRVNTWPLALLPVADVTRSMHERRAIAERFLKCPFHDLDMGVGQVIHAEVCMHVCT